MVLRSQIVRREFPPIDVRPFYWWARVFETQAVGFIRFV